ncbi:hypothetical protein ACX1H4_14910 [Yersinia enterocolitica]|uniref:hypothetical protein n=1 Tax=Yersinia TaxID=629 RepID=UPI0006794B29|nr:hypothetical protein [Yersinia frederiksenii]ELI8020181.1 hypothetical protein [Yersinia enterocolitica]ELW8197278.1 hypothetical protein [Yersinia enterocolitica]OWF75068.1 hypothetical protein B4902_02965 [Yersinia frederiksenii]HDV7528418.1 hypothetical protein [Yersinia enterocolitica]HDX9049881.1 hypothetical protein [Yersinia enterocolitica]
MNDNHTREANASIIISDKGYPLPIELRPLWRLGIMCLCIRVLGTDIHGLNINKLRVATWMLNRPQLWGEYYKSLYSKNEKIPSISIDSNTDKAIELGIAKEFFIFNNESIKLIEIGKSLLEICDELGTYTRENEFLLSISSKFTNTYIKRVVG